MTKKTNSSIAPELTKRMGRLPFLWHYYNEKDGHVLVTQTPAGIADRVVVLGHGKRALDQLHAMVTLIEGTLAYLGYEDPASARIDINRWVSIRWLRREEVHDSGADVEAFKQYVTERGNEFLADSKVGFYSTFDESQIKQVTVRNWDTGKKYLVYVCGLTFNPNNPVHVAYDENYRGEGIAYWDVPLLFETAGPFQHGVGYMLDDVTEVIPADR
jgi:hypothetical protein